MASEFNVNKDLPLSDPLLIGESVSLRTNKLTRDQTGSFRYGWRSCCFRNKKRIAIVIGSVTGAVLLLTLTAVAVFLFLPNILNSSISDLRPKLSQEDPLQTDNSYPLGAFAGRWRMVKQENLDEILEALGSGFLVRLIAPSIPSAYEITVHGPSHATLVTKEYYTVTKEVIFDEEVEDTTNDGRNVLANNTMEGKLWVKNERWEVDGEEKYCKTVAEVIRDDDGVMKIIGKIHAGGVISTRTYVRIE